MADDWKTTLARLLAAEDHAALIALARGGQGRLIRFLSSRVYSDGEEKWRAVRAIGAIFAEPGAIGRERAVDLLRRFAWALNDESGATPFGVPEAMGEILAVRSEFQLEFLPILCSLLTEDDMSQTGAIERGAVWALGRVGAPVATASSGAVAELRRIAAAHPEAETREAARRALAAIVSE